MRSCTWTVVGLTDKKCLRKRCSVSRRQLLNREIVVVRPRLLRDCAGHKADEEDRQLVLTLAAIHLLRIGGRDLLRVEDHALPVITIEERDVARCRVPLVLLRHLRVGEQCLPLPRIGEEDIVDPLQNQIKHSFIFRVSF